MGILYKGQKIVFKPQTTIIDEATENNDYNIYREMIIYRTPGVNKQMMQFMGKKVTIHKITQIHEFDLNKFMFYIEEDNRTFIYAGWMIDFNYRDTNLKQSEEILTQWK